MKINRDVLLESAFRLFMSANYEKASFAELGKMLNMSKAGLFKYYLNKQELFKAVADKYMFGAQNPQNKFAGTSGTLAEFIEEYVQGVRRTMKAIVDIAGEDSAPNGLSPNSGYYHFLLQVLRYYPDSQEKMREIRDSDYAHWRAAILRAVESGELKPDTDVEASVMLFRQLFMGLAFEMSFFSGLDTEVLAKHLRYVYSLLASQSQTPKTK